MLELAIEWLIKDGGLKTILDKAGEQEGPLTESSMHSILNDYVRQLTTILDKYIERFQNPKIIEVQYE